MDDDIEVENSKSTFQVEQTFSVDGKPVPIARAGPNGTISLSSRQKVDASATQITVTPEP
jgi:hypothetical protein